MSTVEVVTAGRPERAVAEAAARLAAPGTVLRLTVEHDDNCLCLTGAPTSRCSCEVVRLRADRLR